MKISRNWHPLDTGSVVTIGNFDGVHVGHQALLAKVKSRASSGLESLAMTFEPHPLAFLAPDRCPPRLIDLRTKVGLIAQQDIDHVCVMSFSRKLATMPPVEFVDALIECQKMEVLVVGGDFRFGHKREGNVDMLKELSRQKGFGLDVIDDKAMEGQRISSKLVRKTVSCSDFEGAARMLARPYRIGGMVVRGKGIGADLGWPTTNISFAGKPAMHGIYAAHAYLGNEKWPAAVSVGNRPAVGGTALVMEAHLIGFEGDAYGKRIELEPVRKIRDEMDFDSLGKLSVAIRRDVEECRALLGS